MVGLCLFGGMEEGDGGSVTGRDRQPGRDRKGPTSQQSLAYNRVAKANHVRLSPCTKAVGLGSTAFSGSWGFLIAAFLSSSMSAGHLLTHPSSLCQLVGMVAPSIVRLGPKTFPGKRFSRRYFFVREIRQTFQPVERTPKFLGFRKGNTRAKKESTPLVTRGPGGGDPIQRFRLEFFHSYLCDNGVPDSVSLLGGRVQ